MLMRLYSSASSTAVKYREDIIIIMVMEPKRADADAFVLRISLQHNEFVLMCTKVMGIRIFERETRFVECRFSKTVGSIEAR